MKAYLLTTGALFGLITIAHILRIIVEWPRFASRSVVSHAHSRCGRPLCVGLAAASTVGSVVRSSWRCDWTAGRLVLARAVTYSTLFIGLLLIFLPARILAAAGVGWPGWFGVWQAVGIVLGSAGAALALSGAF